MASNNTETQEEKKKEVKYIITDPSLITGIDLLTKAQYESYHMINVKYNIGQEDEYTVTEECITPIAGDWWLKGSSYTYQDTSVDPPQTVTVHSDTRYVFVVHKDKVKISSGVVNSHLFVRPVLTLSHAIASSANPTQEDPVTGCLYGDLVKFAGLEWIVLDGTHILARQSIGNAPFNLNWQEYDAQNFDLSPDGSYIKKFLAAWLHSWTNVSAAPAQQSQSAGNSAVLNN